MEELIEKIKIDIIEQLNLEDVNKEEVGPDDLLFGEGLGLDSIDALELIVLLEKKYGVKVASPEEGKEIFKSLRTLAQYVQEKAG